MPVSPPGDSIGDDLTPVQEEGVLHVGLAREIFNPGAGQLKATARGRLARLVYPAEDTMLTQQDAVVCVVALEVGCEVAAARKSSWSSKNESWSYHWPGCRPRST